MPSQVSLERDREDFTDRLGKDHEKTEFGVIQPQAKGWQQPPEAGKSKQWILL